MQALLLFLALLILDVLQRLLGDKRLARLQRPPPWTLLGRVVRVDHTRIAEPDALWGTTVIKAKGVSRLKSDHFTEALEVLLALLPGLSDRMRRMKPDLLARLCEDTNCVAARLVQLKSLFPEGTDVEQLVTNRPDLLLDGEFQRLPAALAKLEAAFPNSDVGGMVAAQPLLLVEDINLVIEELRRLLPKRDPIALLSDFPHVALSASLQDWAAAKGKRTQQISRLRLEVSEAVEQLREDLEVVLQEQANDGSNDRSETVEVAEQLSRDLEEVLQQQAADTGALPAATEVEADAGIATAAAPVSTRPGVDGLQREPLRPQYGSAAPRMTLEQIKLQVDALAAAPLQETAAGRAERLERLRTLRAIAVQTAQLKALGQGLEERAAELRMRLQAAEAAEALPATAPAKPGAGHEPQPIPATEPPRAPDRATWKLRLVAGAAGLPHPDKAERGGEDAHFVSGAGGGAFGVSDGVSSWAEVGVDAAEYSRRLMRGAKRAVEWGRAQRLRARGVLAQAHVGARGVPGSATALIALLHPPDVLEVASLGDSGFRLMRSGQCAFASEVQQHRFNMPLQLACEELLPGADGPDDADVYELDLVAGDVLIAATDGLFDNMWDRQLEQLVESELQKGGPRTTERAAALAARIAAAARANSLNQHFRSPWVVAAAEAGVLPLWKTLVPRGGKLDDCTVVVAFLEPR
ncbi:hypothetical protein WJX81_005353 [Elliptochloris bilobata]|uniref:Protein phosphatase n=1 Tax=Elliptochloris bilobata TaxID=381761 RepID=A0AAW1SDP0_9CHLO